MELAYAAACLLCGRDLGHVVGGRFFVRPGMARPALHDRRLRCGHCRGSILLEPDPTVNAPRDWADAMHRELAVGG